MNHALKNEYILAPSSMLDLKKTFECGQCFRWNESSPGVYLGAAAGKALKIWQKDDKIVCETDENSIPFWLNYFDLETDYSEGIRSFSEPEYLKTCTEFGKGIRILRQEAWEALISFIISQCNNIPRIKKIISVLCESFGDELEYGLYSFPAPEKLAVLTENDLAHLKSGYRAEYILNAARSVCDGSLKLDELAELSSEEAFIQIRKMRGIGDKVANCFMLYGLHRMERFPIDVWMRRALERHFPKNYDPTVLGDFAGLAQQYIFYYARTNEHTDNLRCS